MQPTDITIEILKDIRTEARATNARLDQTNARLDETNARLEAVRSHLSDKIDGVREELSGRIDALARHVVEAEIRTATAIVDLSGTVRELTSVLRSQSDLRPRVEKCEQEIEAIKKSASRRARKPVGRR